MAENLRTWRVLWATGILALVGADRASAQPFIRAFIDQTEVFPDETFDLGDVEVGDNLPVTVTIVNAGDEPLTLNGEGVFGFAAADYSLGTFIPPSPVQPGATTSLPFTFTPSAAGPRLAFVRIFTNDPFEPAFVFNLRGDGIVPIVDPIELEPIMVVRHEGIEIPHNATLDLDQFFNELLQVNETVEIDLEVENTGTADLDLLGLVLDNVEGVALEEIDGGNTTVAPGETTIVTVAMTPLAAGPQQATVGLLNNSAVTPYNVVLSATVVEVLEKERGGMCGSGAGGMMPMGFMGLALMGMGRPGSSRRKRS